MKDEDVELGSRCDHLLGDGRKTVLGGELAEDRDAAELVRSVRASASLVRGKEHGLLRRRAHERSQGRCRATFP
jgi:hypothetical protein